MATNKKTQGSKRKKTNTSKRNKKNSGLVKIIKAILLIAIISALAAMVIKFVPHIMSKQATKDNTEVQNLNTSDKVQHKSSTDAVSGRQVEAEAEGQSSERLVSGTWISSINSTMLTFSENNYTIDFMSVEAPSPMNGTFKIEGEKATFSDDSGRCTNIKGIYRIAFQDSIMVLETIEDDCPKRAASLDSDWRRFDM